ncbi:segment polarity protein dishevelled homolog DVL-2, partial [Chelonoidis abingdonii]|uniref:segment polarity protein dishevelled homolog DVL-2 n=1 Tax=Chelonoidis abingdonii TaxID=106734 RepID=UPI003F499B60
SVPISLHYRVVKEEISDDNAKLPCFNGRVVSWLVSSETPQPEPVPTPVETRPEPSPPPPPLPPLPVERTSGIGDSRPPSFHPNISGSRENLEHETETESVVSLRRERPRRRESTEHGGGHRPNGQSRLERHLAGYESSSTLLTSEIETTSLCDSDDDDTMSRFSSSTEQSSASRLLKRHRRRRKQRPPRLERMSSFSSVTDSTMSLNIITVTLNMGKGGGGWGCRHREGVGSLCVALSRQVNDINFENMSNDDAVRVLREIVHKPGPIVLTVAKCWDPSPQGYFTLPRNEPIQPIDPAAWVSHSAALTGAFAAYPGSSSMSTITSGSSVAESERFDEFNLSVHTDMASVTKAMASPESGLEVRDRMWLKITIPNAFLGTSATGGRRSARRRGSRSSGSNRSDGGGGGRGKAKDEKVAPDSKSGSGSESEYSTRSSLRRAEPGGGAGGGGPALAGGGAEVGGAPQRSHHSLVSSLRSHHSYGPPGMPLPYNPMMVMMMPPGPPSAGPASVQPPGAPPVRDLASVPPELTASRQSFHMAMGNPSEFFVDVM